MGCGANFLKVLLIVINTIFFLAGAAILGVGLWIRFDKRLEDFKGPDSGLDQFRTTLYTAAYILIAFGTFTFLIGFCGCFGAIKKSKILLGIYIFFVTTILAAEIAGGVYAYVEKDKLIDTFTKVATDYVRKNYTDGDNPDDASWNFVMILFDCCGVNNYTDFKNGVYKNENRTVPPACCKQRDPNSGETGAFDYATCDADAKVGKTDGSQLHTIGCKDAVINFVKTNSTVLLGVAAGVAGFELLVLLAAIIYCCAMDKDDY